MDMFDSRSASPMLIAKQMEAFNNEEWIYELKMDGFRSLAYINDEVVDFRNKRNMQMLTKFPELGSINKNVNSHCILDGEIVVLINGVPDFYRLQKRTLLTDPFKIELEARRFPASFVAFDCIYVDGKELLWTPLMERKKHLSGIVHESPRIAVSRYTETNGILLYKAAEERKLEGVVAKKKDSFYHMGKRTKDWAKFKRMEDEEFVVAGYVAKGTHNFCLILAKYIDNMLVFKGRVTSGVTKETIKALQVSENNPLYIFPVENAVWVKPDHVCVVEYMPNLSNSLRQPVFKGFRNDISPNDVCEK